KLVEKLDPPVASRFWCGPPSLALGEGAGHPTICDRDQIPRSAPSVTVIRLTSALAGPITSGSWSSRLRAGAAFPSITEFSQRAASINAINFASLAQRPLQEDGK